MIVTVSVGTVPDPTASDVPRLVSRTVFLEQAEADLLELLPSGDSTCWMRRGAGLVGWGEAARLRVGGADRFETAVQWWDQVVGAAAVRDEVNLPGSGLVAFGSFAFTDAPGDSALVVPSTVVGRRDGRTWVTTTVRDPELPAVPQLGAGPPRRRPAGIRFFDGSRSGADWAGSAVAEAVRRIGAGELDKVVLARELVAVAEEPIDLRWPLARLAERYPTCWTYAIDGLFGATPEMLVRLDNGLVTSRVLAGTIRRTGDDGRDLALAASLARSSKDLEEHEYAVRSVAEALAPFCSSMNVPESPFVLHLANVMHLATDVTGVRAGSAGSLELAAALHPSAAVCGTPTPTARDLIAELEQMDRGRYAGPTGWMDADGNGEWGLALRCAQLDTDDQTRVRLLAGCGIVADSDPDSELAESQAKLVPVRDALES